MVSLLERRIAAGLSQRQVAHLIGSGVPNISAYEHGSKVAGKATADRLERALNLTRDHALVRYGWMTLPRLAADLRRLRKAGGTKTSLRWLAQAIADYRRLESVEERAAWLARPSTTGDRRWDALLAGVAEREAWTARETTPAWAYEKAYYLDEWWFVTDLSGMYPYLFTHSPPELRSRGVFVDPEALESV